MANLRCAIAGAAVTSLRYLCRPPICECWELEAHRKASQRRRKRLGLLRSPLSVMKGARRLVSLGIPPVLIPYATRFYNTHLQGVFCLDYSRLGVFWNLGDRIELEEAQISKFLEQKMIVDVTREERYQALTQNRSLGRVYRLVDIDRVRKQRAGILLQALAVLRGGANQAQFGTDIAPKVLILAGLTCGNPIFNHIFEDTEQGPRLRIEPFKEIVRDYADRIVSRVFIGIRSGYLANEAEVHALSGWWALKRDGQSPDMPVLDGPSTTRAQDVSIEIQVMTPVEAARNVGDGLP